MRRPKVFVVNEVRRRMPDGDMVPAFDLTPASEYGDLQVLHVGPVGVSIDFYLKAFQEALSDYQDEDFILPVGDPALIGAACAIAADMNEGRFTVLRWDREARRYIPTEIDLEKAYV